MCSPACSINTGAPPTATAPLEKHRELDGIRSRSLWLRKVAPGHRPGHPKAHICRTSGRRDASLQNVARLRVSFPQCQSSHSGAANLACLPCKVGAVHLKLVLYAKVGRPCNSPALSTFSDSLAISAEAAVLNV